MVPYPEKDLGPAKALILLMVIVQANKSKVQTVMNFRELNGFVDTFTSNTDYVHRICGNGSMSNLMLPYWN